jgi:hypothetical protein
VEKSLYQQLSLTFSGMICWRQRFSNRCGGLLANHPDTVILVIFFGLVGLIL